MFHTTSAARSSGSAERPASCGRPGIEICRSHHDHRRFHVGVVQAAQLSAAQRVIADLGRNAQIANKLFTAGQSILFDAKLGHPERMDHIQ